MYQVLLFSPEMTATDEYDAFIHDEVTRLRIGYFIIDEIHLIYEWGPTASYMQWRQFENIQ